MNSSEVQPPAREALRTRALRLEYFTVLWNFAEGGIAVAAARASGSVARLGFGLDSFVESASALVLIWRLHAETGAADRAAIRRLDRRAHRMVADSLLLLAAWVALDAGLALANHEQPRPAGGSRWSRSRASASTRSWAGGGPTPLRHSASPRC